MFSNQMFTNRLNARPSTFETGEYGSTVALFSAISALEGSWAEPLCAAATDNPPRRQTRDSLDHIIAGTQLYQNTERKIPRREQRSARQLSYIPCELGLFLSHSANCRTCIVNCLYSDMSQSRKPDRGAHHVVYRRALIGQSAVLLSLHWPIAYNVGRIYTARADTTGCRCSRAGFLLPFGAGRRWIWPDRMHVECMYLDCVPGAIRAWFFTVTGRIPAAEFHFRLYN